MARLTTDGLHAEAQPADAIRAIWESSRSEVMAQVDVIEEAIAAALGGELAPDLRVRAEREAHKLAGSAGTFGFALVSEHARELEHALSGSEPPADLQRLADLIMAVRTGLGTDGDTGGGEEVGNERAAPDAVERYGPVDMLVITADAHRGQRLIEEALSRGLAATSTTTLQTARRHVGGASPGAVLLDLGVSEDVQASLEFLAETARTRPVVVMTHQEQRVDPVEVARRGGRGFLPPSVMDGQAVESVIALRERLRAEGTKVLAIDDDRAVLDALGAVLGAGGLEVETSSDPTRFWTLLERDVPDLVVLDFDMPEVTGPELCRALRNDPRWEGVPVMFLTSRTDAASVHEVFDAGADDFLSKPFLGPEVVARITNRLERVRLYRALADTDGLTGLPNRRKSAETLEDFRRSAARLGQPLSLAILDVDHFKRVNDGFGHAVGDAVLRGVGTALRQTFRGEDVVSRWGGDEFVVGMLGMSEADGRQRIGDFIESVRDRRFGEGAAHTTVTLSAGLAEFPTDGQEIGDLYRAADRALYAAKGEGRDRVIATGQNGGPAHADVVVVEDDPVLGQLIEHALQTRGYRTRWITDGVEAATSLADANPGVVAPLLLLDWDLPGMDGLRLLRMLGANGALDRSRVIMLTARAAEQEVLEALEAGAVDHVAKPFSVPVLMQRVRRAMER